MTIRPLIIGSPMHGGMTACQNVGRPATFVWSSSPALRDVADDLCRLSIDSLVIDPEDFVWSSSALAHQWQVHGLAPCLVVACDQPDILAPTVASTHLVARHLPPVPVGVTGDHRNELHAALSRALEGLAPPEIVARSGAGLAEKVAQWIDTSRVAPTGVTVLPLNTTCC